MSGQASLALLCLVLLARSAGAFYSISYSAEGADKRVANAGGSFVSAPSAEHVADVYARLSGHAPLFKSDSAHLPTLDVLSDTREPALLLEVTGGSKFVMAVQSLAAQLVMHQPLTPTHSAPPTLPSLPQSHRTPRRRDASGARRRF